MNRRPKAKAARRSQGLSRTALARAALAPPLRAAAAVADWAHAFGAGAIDLATLNVDETHHLPQRGSDQERPEIRTEQKARPQLQAPEDRRRSANCPMLLSALVSTTGFSMPKQQRSAPSESNRAVCNCAGKLT